MSKRTRAQREQEGREHEEALRQLPEDEGEAMLEVVSTATEAHVSPIALLAIMEMGSYAGRFIVMAALPNVHRLLHVEHGLQEVVHNILSDLFYEGVRDAVRLLEAWGGRSWGEVDTLLGDLRLLLFGNEHLTPAWFLREYGERKVYTNEALFPGTDYEIYVRRRHQNVVRTQTWWHFMSEVEELGLPQLDTNRHAYRLRLRALHDLIEGWMEPTKSNSDLGWHALLWVLVARYEMLRRLQQGTLGNFMLQEGIRTEFFEQKACAILVAIRLVPEDSPVLLFPAGFLLSDALVLRRVAEQYWFRMPAALRVTDFRDDSKAIEAYRHLHPLEPEPNFTLYQYPTLASFLSIYDALEWDADSEEPLLIRLALQDAETAPRAGHTPAEAYLPFSTYTPDEWKAALMDYLRFNARFFTNNPAASLWPQVRQELPVRLMAFLQEMPMISVRRIESMTALYDGLTNITLNLSERQRHEILLSIPPPRAPDAMILCMRWLIRRDADIEWLFERSLVDDRPVLDLRADLAVYPGSRFMAFAVEIMGPEKPMDRLTVLLRGYRLVFRCFCFDLCENVVRQTTADNDELARFFYHGLSALDTAQLLLALTFVNLREPQHNTWTTIRVLQLLMHGSAEPSTMVLAALRLRFYNNASALSVWEELLTTPVVIPPQGTLEHRLISSNPMDLSV